MRKQIFKYISLYILFSLFWFFTLELLIAYFYVLSKDSVVVELISDIVFLGGSVVFFSVVWRSIKRRFETRIEILEAYQRQYDQVIENSQDAVFFIDGGKIIKCNSATLKLFECTRDEILGQHPYHFSPVWQEGQVSSIEKANEYIEKARKGVPQFFKWKHLKFNGTLFDAEVTLSATSLLGKEVVRGVVRDISEQVKVKERLLLTEIKYREIFDAIRDSIMIIDPEVEKVIEANKTARQRYGFTDQADLNVLLSDFFPIDLIEKLPLMKRELEERDSLLFEARMKAVSGEVYPIEVNIKKIQYDSRELIISVGRNISERIRFRQHIFNAVIEAEEKERSRVAKELHDGVSPIMSAVKLYVQSVSDCQDNNMRRTILEKVGETIDEAIVSLSEISNNLSPHVLENFGLVIALKSFIEKIQEVQAIKFDFNADFESRLPVNIEVTLYRVTVELINNSLKYSNAQKVTIRLMLKDGIHLVYTDNGDGFDVPKAMNEKKGMGLFNITNRVHSLGGEINISSKVGNGVLVKTFIPLERMGHEFN